MKIKLPLYIFAVTLVACSSNPQSTSAQESSEEITEPNIGKEFHKEFPVIGGSYTVNLNKWRILDSLKRPDIEGYKFIPLVNDSKENIGVATLRANTISFESIGVETIEEVRTLMLSTLKESKPTAKAQSSEEFENPAGGKVTIFDYDTNEDGELKANTFYFSVYKNCVMQFLLTGEVERTEEFEKTRLDALEIVKSFKYD